MRILVTGGAGFIGSNFVLNWLEKNNEKVIEAYLGSVDDEIGM